MWGLSSPTLRLTVLLQKLQVCQKLQTHKKWLLLCLFSSPWSCSWLWKNAVNAAIMTSNKMETGDEEEQTNIFLLQDFIVPSWLLFLSYFLKDPLHQHCWRIATPNCCSCGQTVMTGWYLPHWEPDLSIAYWAQISFQRPQKRTREWISNQVA